MKPIYCMLLMTMPALVQAAPPPLYVGLGITGATLDIQDVDDFDLAGGTLKLGYDFSPYLAIEAHVGTTDDDETTFMNVPVRGEITHYSALFARGNLNFNKIRVYGMLGGGFAQVKLESPNAVDEDSESGLAYGAGVELYGTARTALHFEALRYVDADEFNADAVTLGLTHHY